MGLYIHAKIVYTANSTADLVAALDRQYLGDHMGLESGVVRLLAFCYQFLRCPLMKYVGGIIMVFLAPHYCWFELSTLLLLLVVVMILH